MSSHETEILRKLRIIEWLKAELIANVAEIYHAIARNSQQAIAEALAAAVISCFILGRRLGIDFAVLDEAIFTKLAKYIKQDQDVEKWYGDYSEYQRHLRRKG